jgi:hypothetical protein
LFGLPIPVIVFLMVEGLKRVKVIVSGDTARLVNMGLSAAFAVALIYIAPIEEPWVRTVTLILSTFWNSFASAGGYELLQKLLHPEGA